MSFRTVSALNGLALAAAPSGRPKAETPVSGDGSSERGGEQPMEGEDDRSGLSGTKPPDTEPVVASGVFGSGAGAPTRKLRGALGLAIIEEEGASGGGAGAAEEGSGELQSRKGKRKLSAFPPRPLSHHALYPLAAALGPTVSASRDRRTIPKLT